MHEPSYYMEQVNRYVVESHEELPESHKASYRLRGIDPDTLWNLIWSFPILSDALEQALADQVRHQEFCEKHGYKPWQTYRVRDLGEPVEVKRLAWL